MAEKIIIEVELNDNDAQKRAALLTQALQRLNTERAELSKELKTLQAEEVQILSTRVLLTNESNELAAANRESSDEYKRIQVEIKGLDTEFAGLRVEINEVSNEMVTNRITTQEAKNEQRLLEREIKSVDGSLNDNRAQLIRLKREYDNLSEGINATREEMSDAEKQILDLTDTISEQEQATGRFQRNVGNYAGGIRDTFAAGIPGAGEFLDIISGTNIGIAGIVGILAGAGAELAKFSRELAEIRSRVQLITGATGDQLDDYTARVQAVANISESLDVTEVLEQNSQASTLFNETFERSNDLFSVAIATQVDGGARLIDVYESVGARARDAGVDLESLYSLIIQEEGKVSERGKGVEAIAEAFVSLREQTPATREALTAIGLDADKTFKLFEEEGFTAVQLISERLQEFEDTAPEVGLILADVFKGPGEDAGVQYIKSLADTDLNLKNVAASGGEVVQRNLEIIETERQLNLEFNQALGSIGNVFDDLIRVGKQLTVFFLDSLEPIIQANVGAFQLLADGIAIIPDLFNKIRATGAGVFAFLRSVVFGFADGVRDTFSSLGDAFEAFSSGDLLGGFRALDESITFSGNVGEEAGEAYTEAYNESIKNLRPLREGFESDAETEGGEVGRALGESINAEAKAGIAIRDLSNTLSSLNQQLELATTDEDRLRIAGEIDVIEQRIEALRAPLEAAKKAAGGGDVSTTNLTQTNFQTQEITITNEETNLRIAVLQEERERKLEIENITNQQKLEINREYLEELSSIQRETSREFSEEELTSQKVTLISRLEIVEEGTQEEFALRASLAVVDRDLQLKDQKLSAEQRIQIEVETLTTLTELETQSIQASVDRKLEAFEIEESNLRINFANKVISEEEFNTQRFELEQQRLELELVQFEEGSLLRIEKEVELAELRAEMLADVSEGEKEAAEELSGAQAEAAKLSIELKQEAADAIVGLSLKIIEGIVGEEKAEKIARAVKKAGAVIDVGINLQKQLGSIAAAAAAIVASGPPIVTAPLGAAFSAANIPIAIIGAVARVATILAFEEGGETTGGQHAGSGLIVSYEGQQVEVIPTQAKGGQRNKPTLGLIGEKGPEYVIPNKVLTRPEVQPMIASLERIRQSVIRPYEHGGITGIGAQIPTFTDGGFSEREMQNDFDAKRLGRIIVDANREMVESLPAPIVGVQDINDGQENVRVAQDSRNV